MNESASLTVLHFPGSSAMTADYFITVRAGSESESLELTVVSRDNTRAFESRINDAMLQKIKHQCGCGHDSDEEWFRDVSTAINHNEVTVVTLIPALEVHHPRRGAVMFPLEPLVPCQGFSGYNVILDTLLKSIRVRLKPREVQRQLEELCTRESEVQQSVAEAEKELSGLQDQIAQTREIELVNQRRIEQLEQEIARIEEEQRSAGIQTVAFDEEDDVHRCRVRVPIIGERKDLDGDLLRMVKSKYLTSEDKSLKDQEVKYCTLYMPMTTSELEAATGVLSTGQKRAVWECLTKIDEWDFDVFSLQKLMSGDDHDSLAWQTQGGSLLITTYALFLRYGCFQKFNLDERLVLNWLSVVEGGYNPNPYHNSMHAADVVHITHYILSAGKLIATCKLSDEDIFASLFAAAIHDYNHPGINNNFHIKASTYLATLYNDRSILENFHVSSVFELMKLPRFNVLSCFSDEQRRDIRDTVVEMVLATDMGLHAKILGQFRRRLQENHDLSKKDDVRLALSMAVKTADISNCGRPEKLYLKWCAKIADEFYMQGDRERTSGMPCSPFMDRYQPAMAKGQIAFINYIVIPLFESISELLPEMHFTVDFAENNKNYWMNHDDSVK